MEGQFLVINKSIFDNATIFFSKTSNRELYKHKNILEFVDDTYVLSNPISDKNIDEMKENMDDNDVIEFDKFLERNWGIKASNSERSKAIMRKRMMKMPNNGFSI